MRQPSIRFASLPGRATATLLVAALTGIAPLSVAAQADGGAGIYTCTDPSGRRLTSDRPIVDCIGREQRVLNSDGSVRRVVPPTMTAEERAEFEERERRRAAERRSQRDIARRDSNLVQRYPNEKMHDAARAAALEDMRKALRASEARLLALAEERKPLMVETEFYVRRSLPGPLKAALDANEASTEAQRTLVMFQQAEIERINATFDLELQRLRRLWAGAAPGSLGPLEAGAGNTAVRR